MNEVVKIGRYFEKEIKDWYERYEGGAMEP